MVAANLFETAGGNFTTHWGSVILMWSPTEVEAAAMTVYIPHPNGHTVVPCARVCSLCVHQHTTGVTCTTGTVQWE
jgi:hypothetical protein